MSGLALPIQLAAAEDLFYLSSRSHQAGYIGLIFLVKEKTPLTRLLVVMALSWPFHPHEPKGS